MKRLFLLSCVICVLYGLSWANNFGSSVDGEQAAVTFTHTADCDSARVEFGYDGDGGADTLNFYAEIRVLPCFSGDGKLLMGEGLELDSIGTHVVKITYFEDDGDATADGYVTGIWIHENPVSSRCSGSGTYTVTLYLLDDSDSTAVSGVTININDSTSGDWQAGDDTPANGIRQFSLDASTFAIHLQDPPNAITSPEYMTISADTTDTFWVTVFDPGTPPAATLCRIYGWTYDKNDNPRANCKFTVYIVNTYSPVTNTADNIITPFRTSAFSNTNGYYYMDVYRSDSLTAGKGGIVKYHFRLEAPDGTFTSRKRHYEVPDSTTHKIVW